MKKPGRNDPCPCGSGKKFKQCCQVRDGAQAENPRPANPLLTSSIQQAVQHHQAGRLPEAEAIYQQILQVEPDHPDALNLLGVMAHQTGKNEIAVELIGKAIRVRPSSPTYYSNLALALHAQGKLEAAAENYDRALALKPDYAGVHNNAGNVRRDQGRLDVAIEHYRKALAHEPGYAEAHYNLGIALHESAQLEAAVECYRKALALKPDYVEAHSNLGSALQHQGNLEEAEASYRCALALNPEHAEAHAGQASLHIWFGRFEAAREAISRALKSRPEHPNAWAMMASIRKMTLEDGDWLKTATRLISSKNPALSPRETVNLQFAIGKFCDDTKQYDLAFAAYRHANTLKQQMERRFDRAGLTTLIDTLITTYTAEFFNRPQQGASSSRLPVLIVGMPRSGTSLTEQIIASHPGAFGAGELSFWGLQAKANRNAVLSGVYDPVLIAEFVAGYESLLRRHAGEAARVVDKLPGNFLWLGLIHTVFPQARILHTQRNPVDTCLSIYFQNFNASHAYGTDLEDLAFYYREQIRLMNHWRGVLPANRFLEVPYESLIEDQRAWSRRMIEFIGLDWDERCLDFHKTERKVGTASNWQVRQQIYSSSKARWRHYEKHVGPLLKLLEPV